MARRDTQSENIQCPKFEKIFKHSGNLKQHQMQQECTKNQEGNKEMGEKNGKRYSSETHYGDSERGKVNPNI